MKKLSTNAIQKILTMMNTLGVSLTYFDSIINFLWHIGKSDHPLTDCKESWEAYVVAMATILCVFIAMNNQRAMPGHIAKFLNHTFRKNSYSIPKTTHTPKEAVVDAIGCFAKAAISTISLYSSINDYIDNWKISSGLAVVSFFGNLLAVFSVLMEHRQDDEKKQWSLNLPSPVAKFVARFVHGCYGLAQGGIYSNAMMNPLVITQVLASRPAFNSPDMTSRILFWATLYPCAEFMWGSGAAMYKRTLKVFGPLDQEEELKHQPSCWQKWRGGVASVFRSWALIAGIFCFFYLLTQGNTWASAIPAALSILAAPGVFSLLYPVAEEEEEYYQVLGNPNIFVMGKSPLLINSQNEDNQSGGYSFKVFGVF